MNLRRITERFEHKTVSGLSLDIAAEVRLGRNGVDGAPFAVAPTSDNGTAIALCDGTSDWGEGQRGSRIAASTMVAMMVSSSDEPARRLCDAMMLGGLKMSQAFVGEPGAEEFPPTCVGAMLYLHDRSAYVAWIGSGPVFHVRANTVEQKTHDHLLVDDVIAAGHLTPEQAKDWPHRNVLTRALGLHAPNATPTSRPETAAPFDVAPGDSIVLCYGRVASSIEVAKLPSLIRGPAAAAATRLLDVFPVSDRVVEIAAIVVAIS